MNNKIIIINGPNLNLLGEREQSQYGSTTFEELKEICLNKSKELGLVDGLGSMEDIIQEKFGKKVLIKKYDKPEGWLKKKLSSKISTEFGSVIDEIESRSLWNKFGL